MHRLASAFVAQAKSNLAMQMSPTHDCMRGHSCLVEAFSSIKLIQYAAGGTRPVNRRKYRDLENRLDTLKLRLQAGEITVVQYADAASYLLHI